MFASGSSYNCYADNRLHQLERRVAVLEQRDRIARGVEDAYQREQERKRAFHERQNEAWRAEKERRVNAAQDKWLAAGWWTRKLTNSPKKKARRPTFWDVMRDDIEKERWLCEQGLSRPSDW